MTTRRVQMTKRQAEQYVRSCGETDGPDDATELAEIFRALYGRAPDAYDERDGVWSLCCAAVDETDETDETNETK